MQLYVLSDIKRQIFSVSEFCNIYESCYSRMVTHKTGKIQRLKLTVYG